MFGSPLLGTLLVAVAIPLSVKIGRKAAATGRWRGRLDLLHTFMAVLMLAAIAAVRPESWAAPDAYADGGDAKVLAARGGQVLWATDGRPITNIYPYDSDGNLLHNVLLYDQDGVPITNTADVDDEGSLTAQAPLDANGTPVDHAYPLQRHRCVWTQNGGLIPFGDPLPPPAVVVPRLAEPTATVPSTTTDPPTSTVPATTTTAPAEAGATPAGAAPPAERQPRRRPRRRRWRRRPRRRHRGRAPAGRPGHLLPSTGASADRPGQAELVPVHGLGVLARSVQPPAHVLALGRGGLPSPAPAGQLRSPLIRRRHPR